MMSRPGGKGLDPAGSALLPARAIAAGAAPVSAKYPEQPADAEQDDDAADQDHQGLVRDLVGRIGGKGRGQRSAQNQPADNRPELEADRRGKSPRRSE